MEDNNAKKVYEIINLEKNAKTEKTFGIINTVMAGILSSVLVCSVIFDGIKNTNDGIVKSILAAILAGNSVLAGINTKRNFNRQDEKIKKLKKQVGINETR